VGWIPLRDHEFMDRFLAGYDESGETRPVDLRLKATIE
jgi:hypothetical protein